MALFSKKKETKVKAKPTEKKSEVSSTVSVNASSHIIVRPRITEKGSSESAKGSYVFDIWEGANKQDVKKAIYAIYKVSPAKVTVVPVRSKKVFVRGKWGQTGGGKKAYVHLKKGDKIEFV
jgi:large subunit ribosomal protein L23